MNRARAMMPAMMFSIKSLQFLARAGVPRANDEEGNYDTDEYQVRHSVSLGINWLCAPARAPPGNRAPRLTASAISPTFAWWQAAPVLAFRVVNFPLSAVKIVLMEFPWIFPPALARLSPRGPSASLEPLRKAKPAFNRKSKTTSLVPVAQSRSAARPWCRLNR